MNEMQNGDIVAIKSDTGLWEACRVQQTQDGESRIFIPVSSALSHVWHPEEVKEVVILEKKDNGKHS